MKKIKFFLFLIFYFLFFTSFAFSKKYIRVYYVLYGNSILGDCIYIEMPNGANAIIDGGHLSDNSNPDLYLDDFLDSRGVTTINHMILTHPDADHSSGLKMVMDNYKVENFYCTGDTETIEMGSTRIANEGCNVYKMKDYSFPIYLSGPKTNVGTSWDDNVEVRVLSADDSKTGNGRSLIIKLSLGKSTFYFGGDAEGTQETYIMSTATEESPIDIFKTEHHGSNTNGSNGDSFIKWMKPKIAIIQTGGHTVRNGPPADEIIRRLIDNRCIIYRNDLDGTILIKADDEGNYDVVRMTAFEYLNLSAIYEDGKWYDEVIPSPKAFPIHTYSGGFTLGSAVSRTYILPPPDLPTGLSVVERSSYSVTLNWNYDSSPSIEGYFIFYSTYPNGDPGANNGWKNPGMSEETGIYKRYNDIPVKATPYTVTGLAPNTFYYFRLSVITTYYYERRYSNEASTKTLTPDPVSPEKILDLTALSGSSHREIELSWTSPHEDGTEGGSVSGYILKYSTFSVASISGDTTKWWNLAYTYPLSIIVTSTGTPQTATVNLKEGVTYYFAIKSFDDVYNYSEISNEASAFSPDLEGPVFLYSNVEDYPYSFNPSTSCIVVFNEKISNPSEIYLIKEKDNLDNALSEKISYSTLTVSGSTITYNFSLSYNSEYKLVISSSITDVYGNKTSYKEIIFRTLMRKEERNILTRNSIKFEFPENSLPVLYAWVDFSSSSFRGKINTAYEPYLEVLNVYDINLRDENNKKITQDLNDSIWITIPYSNSSERPIVPYSYEGDRWVRVVYWEDSGGAIKFKTAHLSYFALMAEAKNDLNIKCYPNPAKDYLYFEGLASYTKIRFYTLDGRLKKEVIFDYNKEKTFKYKINLDFPSGLYFWEAISYERGKVKDRETGRIVIIK